jgi:hypothetical protein
LLQAGYRFRHIKDRQEPDLRNQRDNLAAQPFLMALAG